MYEVNCLVLGNGCASWFFLHIGLQVLFFIGTEKFLDEELDTLIDFHGYGLFNEDESLF